MCNDNISQNLKQLLRNTIIKHLHSRLSSFTVCFGNLIAQCAPPCALKLTLPKFLPMQNIFLLLDAYAKHLSPLGCRYTFLFLLVFIASKYTRSHLLKWSRIQQHTTSTQQLMRMLTLLHNKYSRHLTGSI